jgi:hypothetical protein
MEIETAKFARSSVAIPARKTLRGNVEKLVRRSQSEIGRRTESVHVKQGREPLI